MTVIQINKKGRASMLRCRKRDSVKGRRLRPRRVAGSLLIAIGLTVVLPAVKAAPPMSIYRAAVEADDRPEEDTKRDANRKPELMLEFSGIKHGDKIGELGAFRGYYTRILSHVVGPNGKVYAFNPDEYRNSTLAKGIEAMSSEPGHENIVSLTAPVEALNFPSNLDMVWNTNNYHDFYFVRPGEGGIVAENVDRLIFEALKPGGIYFITDHSAVEGSDLDGVEYHRIDEAVVKRNVLKVGFQFVEGSDILRNPDDPRDVMIFDESVSGKTDQFVLKFRKPE